MIKLDLKNSFYEEELEKIERETKEALETLVGKTGEGNDYLGWLDLPVDYDKDEFERILKASEKIKKNSEVLVVIGIGGSYLGARAVIEALSPSYKREGVEILYAGNHLSSVELSELIDYLDEKDFAINVISKSGTTTEPGIAFRLIKAKLEEKYDEKEVRDRIFVTTDRERGALKTLATDKDFESFVVPDDVGGRFSVLTAVGLLPIAVAGIDIKALMKGAQRGREKYTVNDFSSNDAMRYAGMRNILYRHGKKMEILVRYEPKLMYFAEWWKQLYGESEGKDGKGIFPNSVGFTTDLHSLGQIIQDGERMMFETVLEVKTPEKDLTIIEDKDDLDGLNYLAGRTVDYVNKKACEATIKAHVTGDVPNLGLSMEALNEEALGELIYFFEIACGISGYILGVNPFNQPGVEEYKKNMFILLEKPGY